VEEETDVVSDNEESLQSEVVNEVRYSADFGNLAKAQSRNKPINSIRDTALNNFNRFKDLNKCLNVQPRPNHKQNMLTAGFIHLSQKNIKNPIISLVEEAVDENSLSPNSRIKMPNTARN